MEDCWNFKKPLSKRTKKLLDDYFTFELKVFDIRYPNEEKPLWYVDYKEFGKNDNN